MVGQTLGHYRIEAKAGQGGMGVVYRAVDTHLNRPAAIKLLRPEAVANAERKKRFIHEAKTASALNHPNIVTIYHIGVEGAVDYIAMEYVSGAPLDQLLRKGSLPPGDAVQYAVQIAAALAAAHEAGIVHRDLKPANVMVTGKGHVKLLDFGVAKLTERTDSSESSPTATLGPETAPGMAVGTVAYMSPEQSQGKKVDSRSDTYSFGLVLQEMMGKDRPVPRDVRKIVARCLQTDPARRFQLMEDVRLALEDAELAEDVATAPAAASRRSSAVWPVIAIVAAVIGAGLAWRFKPDRPIPQPLLRRLTMDSGLTTDPALSPDGRLVAYASDRGGEGNLDIWVQQVAGGEPRRLTSDPVDETEPSFSPDGSRVAFRSERDGGGIYVISALGGDARRIAGQGRRPRWAPDGKHIAYWTGLNMGRMAHVSGSAGIFVVEVAGGEPRRILPDFAVASSPVWSPDGARLLFLGNREPTFDTFAEWWITPIQGGSVVETGGHSAILKFGLTPTADAYFPPDLWTSEGVLFAARHGDSVNIWRIPLTGDGRAASPLVRLTRGAGFESNPSAANGHLVYSTLENNIDLWSLPVETTTGRPAGSTQRLTHDPALDLYPWFSVNGKRLIYVSTRSGTRDVWLKDMPSGKEAIAATNVGTSLPILSRDGFKILYLSGQSKYSLLALPPEGAALASTPQAFCEDCHPSWDLSASGTWLLYGRDSDQFIAARNISTGKTTDLLKTDVGIVARLRISPDDRWLALMQRNAGASRLFVAPFRPGQLTARDQWIPLNNGDARESFPTWSPDGSRIYYLSDRDGRMCVWAQRVDPSTGRPAGEPAAVWHVHDARHSISNVPVRTQGVAVGPDRIVVSLNESTGNIWMSTDSPRPPQPAK